MNNIAKVGIIGGGLMGKEAASAFGRWFALNDYPVAVELSAVCDLDEEVLGWYEQIPSVQLITSDYEQILASDQVDVVYVALPHHLHEEYYIDILESGKDLLAEKPFGMNLQAAKNIYGAFEASSSFVRCSSEFPFLPGAQRVIAEINSGRMGDIMEIHAGFLHASDLNPQKPINWKRQSQFCGEIGVMGDLGIHVIHIPLRLGWQPRRLYSQLQKVITRRPDGQGGWAESDTWNNATLTTDVNIEGKDIPMTLEMKRLAPGQKNSWYIEVLGTEGGVRYSTKDTKTLWTFRRGEEQAWQQIDLGFQGPFPTITGGIFEVGFPDYFMQMLAAYFAEREGSLNGRFGCLTPQEALMSHHIFQAALESKRTQSVVEITY
ncbi:Predicted dehydrogenase [Fodinibius roseus]|uniref:Predicted dehydrogenase n=2 Tax=Fodinibius roseus TaxID=1194090 RepID=A0A1M5LBW4_9BACT|nr:Predicted dehydrogenase [Fodinibius roseus]